MFDPNILTQAVEESVYILFENCFRVIAPYFAPVLISALVVAIIKGLINRAIEFVCIGYSAKEIKHKKARASKAVDFLSALSDILPKNKNE